LTLGVGVGGVLRGARPAEQLVRRLSQV
jgi:hypothetical protein